MGKIIVPNLEDILSLFTETATDAGQYLREHFGRVTAQRKLSEIPVGADASVIDVVTEADLELQRGVAIRLLDRYPYFEFFGEEDPLDVFDPEKHAQILERIRTNRSRYQFIADPLDGTKRYADGDARYGVFLGLLKDNSFVVSLGYMPHQDSMITAIRGRGCWRNGKPFRFDSSVDDCVAVNSKVERTYQSFKMACMFEDLQHRSAHPIIPKHTGSMYDLLFQQQVSAIISFRTNTHDHVLSLAVEEAGGYTLVYQNGEFIRGSEFDWRGEQAKKDANIMCYVAAKDEKTAREIAEIARQFFIFGKETDDYWKVSYLDEIPRNITDIPEWVQLSPRDENCRLFVNFRYQPKPGDTIVRKARYMFEIAASLRIQRNRIHFNRQGKAYIRDCVDSGVGMFDNVPDETGEDIERKYHWDPSDRDSPIYDYLDQHIEVVRHLPDFILDRIRASTPYYEQDKRLAAFLKKV